jgi:formate dehydrogenase subunit delta
VSPDEKLIYMANQIAANFAAMRSADPAAAAADHIARYWDPGMRSRVLEMAAAASSGLSPVAEAAVERLQQAARP